MKAIDGYFLIKPEDLSWKPANPMKIPYADFLERTKSELTGSEYRAHMVSAWCLISSPRLQTSGLMDMVEICEEELDSQWRS